MSFWTVEDAGPYKENGNFLMRTSLFSEVLFFILILLGFRGNHQFFRKHPQVFLPAAGMLF